MRASRSSWLSSARGLTGSAGVGRPRRAGGHSGDDVGRQNAQLFDRLAATECIDPVRDRYTWVVDGWSAPLRVLVIDNYDSFTFNLVHALAAYAGQVPTVVRNDDPTWRPADLAAFDCVVLSPGPGRPDRSGDFGICAQAIKRAEVPLLGVCLGHQGICRAFGGNVVPATEPMHGRTSPIRHTGDQLFDGIPQGFLAVRYHSLMATDIADPLHVIARTEDQIAMAVRHRRRPLWGVQFHPESICTEHGGRLLANFVALARDWRRTHPSTATPTPARSPTTSVERAQSRRTASSRASATHRVLCRRLTATTDAETAFHELYRDSPTAFWLDRQSARESHGRRVSLMGDAGGPLARVASADIHRGEVTVDAADGGQVHRTGFFDWMRADLARHRIDAPALPFDFALGWVGYLGYELKAECGGAQAHRSPHPDAMMIFADRVVAFDHDGAEIFLLALAAIDDDGPARAWIDATERRLATCRRVAPASEPIAESLAGPRPRHSRGEYLRLIEECQRQIRDGETYEVCLTNMLEVAGRLDAWPAYRVLRRDNPAPYAAFLRFGGLAVLSSSPERFLRIGVDHLVESKPIKGTRARGATAADDRRIVAELAGSVKDRAENLMIVDLVRHDLGSCAEPGSVRVTRMFDVETYRTVHQLVSTVRATIREGLTAVDCVRAAFPGGSMTGAPKIRTLSIIDALERGPRGVYSGAIGYFSLSGSADLGMTIRTVVAEPELMRYGVGGAIVALSDPAAEYHETEIKAAPLLALIAQRFPDEPA